jgi:hypothetical protein
MYPSSAFCNQRMLHTHSLARLVAALPMAGSTPSLDAALLQDGCTALWCASWTGQLEMVRVLLAAGASTNSTCSLNPVGASLKGFVSERRLVPAQVLVA